MSKCEYLIDISPYDPLCDHPCRLYGGGAVEAECETCQYRIEDLEAENAKLRELVSQMYSDMQGVLDMSTDTVWVDSIGTLRDRMDYHMQDMAELGMPPADYEKRRRELGIEVD